MDKIEMLWSGGWDSTYMLCMEARKPITIRPYYIVFHRPGEKEERSAIFRIFKKIKQHKEFKARILPVKFIDKEVIKVPDEIKRVFYKFRPDYSLGGQYLQLSSFALQHEGIYLGQERFYENPGHLTKLLYDKGKLTFDNNQVGYLDKTCSDEDVFLLFGHYRFPIALKNELMMVDDAKRLGFIDIMDESWFCYYPTKDGKPCGTCLPCITKYNQHMYDRLPLEALARAEVKVNLPKLSVGVDLVRTFENYCKLKDGYSPADIFRVGNPDDEFSQVMIQKMLNETNSFATYFEEKINNAMQLLKSNPV